MDPARATRTVSTGWTAVDGALSAADRGDLGLSQQEGQVHPRVHPEGGLVRGAVHEWFGVSSPGLSPPNRDPQDEGWSPPLFLLTHLAKRAVLGAQSRGAPDQVVWIGQNVWPYPRALSDSVSSPGGRVVQAGDAPLGHQLRVRIALAEDGQAPEPDLLHRSLFVAPDGSSKTKETSERLWAIDTALRCPGVTAVVADGTGLTMAATRRLQLAAASTGVLVLLARPPQEVGEISAATTRWSVTRGGAASDGPALSWDLTLLRAKGAQQLSRQLSPLEAAHTPKKITAALMEALTASRGSGGEDMGRRRNQPNIQQHRIHRYVHSYAPRLSTPSTFVFYRPIPAPTPKGDASAWSPEDLLSSLDQNERRARLDRRALQ